MAATRIMSIHINKGKTARQCIGDRLDYIMNPKKTDGGILISTYACSPETAADEFILFRQEYQQNTGRTQDNEIIAYHVRQAFKPEEITPEEANEIGKELASRMTGDQFAYVVATHIDKHHVHNHIIICSTDLGGQHKYRDVKQSARIWRRSAICSARNTPCLSLRIRRIRPSLTTNGRAISGVSPIGMNCE